MVSRSLTRKSKIVCDISIAQQAPSDEISNLRYVPWGGEAWYDRKLVMDYTGRLSVAQKNKIQSGGDTRGSGVSGTLERTVAIQRWLPGTALWMNPSWELDSKRLERFAGTTRNDHKAKTEPSPVPEVQSSRRAFTESHSND